MEGKKEYINNTPVSIKDSVSSVLICRKTSGVTWDIKVYDKDPDKAQEKAVALYNKTKGDLTKSGDLK